MGDGRVGGLEGRGMEGTPLNQSISSIIPSELYTGGSVPCGRWGGGKGGWKGRGGHDKQTSKQFINNPF